MQAQAEKSRAFPSPEIGREKQHLNSRAASCIMKATSFAGVMELVDVTDSKSVGSDTVWVRVPPPAPRRSKLCIACSDFFTKVRARSRRCSSFPNRTRFAGLRFGFGSNLETAVSILLRCFTSEQASDCLLRFFISSALPGPSAIFAPLCTTRYFYGIVGLSSSGNPTGLQAEVRGYAGISEPEPPGI